MTTLEIPGRVAERLDGEHIIWLTTVDAKHTPVPTPVWFLWHDGSFVIFSEPGKAKLRNVSAHPAVALNLNSNAFGGDVAVFTGNAHLDDNGPTDDEWSAYLAKYGESFAGINTTTAGFRATYSVTVRVEPHRLRSW